MITNKTAKAFMTFQDSATNFASGLGPSGSFNATYAAGVSGLQLRMAGNTFTEYNTPNIGLNYSGPFMIGCWLSINTGDAQPNPYGVIYSEGNKLQTTGNFSLFIFRKSYNTDTIDLYMRNNNVTLQLAGNFPFTLTTTPKHVLVGRIGDSYVAFVNGQEVTVTMTSSQTALMNTNTYALVGGYYSAATTRALLFKGNLDELYIDRIEPNAADAKRLMCGLHPLERA